MGSEAEETAEVGAQATADGESGGSDGVDQQEGSQDPTPTGDASGGSGGVESLPKWAQEHIRELRGEAAGYRTQLRETQKEMERVNLDDNERAIEEAKDAARREAEESFNERLKQAEARSVLAQNRIVNPNDKTLQLLDLSSVEVDDTGRVSGLDKAVEALKKEYPSLIEGSNTNPNLGNEEPSPQPVSMNDLIRQAAGRK